VLRHHLVHPMALVAASVLTSGAVLGIGAPRLYLLVAGLVLANVLVEVGFDRLGRPLAPDRRFLFVLVSWPVWFVILGAAGWSHGPDVEYFGEVLAIVALMVTGVVAVVEPFSVAIPWAIASAVALTLGAATGGGPTIETIMPVAAIATGTIFAGQLRSIVETFLSSRRLVLADIATRPATGDAFAVAAGIVEPLARLAAVQNASLLWFTDDDRTIVLAVGGVIPPGFEPGRVVPAERNDLLRERSTSGPWISEWVAMTSDDAYRRSVEVAGVSAIAYAPVSHQGRLIGLVTLTTGVAAGGVAALAELLPIVVEVAQYAGGALAPRLLEHAATSAAGLLVDEILRDGRFWPVFQPIVELATGRTVGYEALSRFDHVLGPQELFNQAAIGGRSRDLELATLGAALDASGALPPDVWLSVNSSAALLGDVEALAELLRDVRRRIVIELSEHEIIDNYGPIRAAIERLGPNRTLAVDDAGAGFASLRHVLDARPTHVKLDIGLVHGVDDDPSRRALVAGFVHFAREAGFSLIAEGIETPAELATLRLLGVELGQGYLLGRPERMADQAAAPALAS